MNFSDFKFDKRLNRAIETAGFETPTPIQAEAIPLVLDGHDLIGTAQTGTGKTAAFVLPILQRLVNGPRKRTRAVIVTPTRELAEQIHQSVLKLSRGTGLRSATVYGGVGARPQIDALRRGAEIIVACPGRFLDHLDRGFARLDNVEFLVLDEADRMLDMGFLPPVRRIIAALPKERQTMLFSATFEPEIEKLARQALSHPKRVAIGMEQPANTVEHAIYPVAHHQKTKLLMSLLKQTDTDSVLIFTRTKHRAHRLSQQIDRKGYSATSLHSDRTQSQRQRAIKGFKSGRFQVMVATDIAARGIDIASISHVINFDMPDTVDAYIHRIGRTGRAERNGDAFTLVTPEDRGMVRALERSMKQQLDSRELDGFEYDEAVPPRPRNQRNQRNNNRNGSGKPRSNRSFNRGQRGNRRRSRQTASQSSR